VCCSSSRAARTQCASSTTGAAPRDHEGGPEASLSIHAGGVDLDLNGSYETGFNENDDEISQWPIPNVFAVARP